MQGIADQLLPRFFGYNSGVDDVLADTSSGPPLPFFVSPRAGIVTKNTLREVRKQLGCPTLNAALLENDIGTGAHFDLRVFRVRSPFMHARSVIWSLVMNILVRCMDELWPPRASSVCTSKCCMSTGMHAVRRYISLIPSLLRHLSPCVYMACIVHHCGSVLGLEMARQCVSRRCERRISVQGELMNPAGTNDGFHTNRHVITDLSLAVLQDSRWCGSPTLHAPVAGPGLHSWHHSPPRYPPTLSADAFCF